MPVSRDLLAEAQEWKILTHSTLTERRLVSHILAKKVAGADRRQLLVALEHPRRLSALTGARCADKDHACCLAETHYGLLQVKLCDLQEVG